MIPGTISTILRVLIFLIVQKTLLSKMPFTGKVIYFGLMTALKIKKNVETSWICQTRWTWLLHNFFIAINNGWIWLLILKCILPLKINAFNVSLNFPQYKFWTNKVGTDRQNIFSVLTALYPNLLSHIFFLKWSVIRTNRTTQKKPYHKKLIASS